MKKGKSKDDQYRVSGKRLKAEVERWKELEARAFRRYIERLAHECELEMIDGRRDW